MSLGTLALTVSTCLSGGCGQLSESNCVTNIKEDANEIILRAANDFNYDNYDLTYDEHQSFTKQKLYCYALENGLFAKDELDSLKQTIVSGDDFVKFGDVEKLFVNEPTSESDVTKATIGIKSEKLYKDFENASISDAASIDGKIVSNNYTNICFDLCEGGASAAGNNEDEDNLNSESNADQRIFELPILNCDANNISASISGKVDGVDFFGILCSKDACINLYNAIANWANNQIAYRASGSSSPAKIIVEAFRTLATTTAIGAALATIIAGVIGTITGALSSLWAEFCALFAAGGPIGVIIGLIIGLIGAACIGVIVAMIVYGYLGKGFAIGWKIHHIFRWEWFCGDLK